MGIGLFSGMACAQSLGSAAGVAVGTEAGREVGTEAGVPVKARSGAVSRPIWEAGLGFTALTLPDYRGAERSRSYILPLPYLVYRGPRFAVDRGGLKAELLDQGRLELDFSINLSVPVRSDGNPARAGMPDLRPALEIGPQLQAELWQSRNGRNRLQLQLPLRYAFALSTPVRDAGFVFHPRLNLDMRDFAGNPGWNAGLVVGPIFATARQHDYFYTVDPEFARPSRPAYEAGGGYSGMQLTLATSKRFARYWLGAFLRADWLSGAAFADSPLVQRKTSVAAGIAFIWIFAEATGRVSRRD